MAGINPSYKFRVVMDDWLPIARTPYRDIHRTFDEMGHGKECAVVNCVKAPGIGWRLKTRLDDMSEYTDLTESEGALTASGGGLVVASGVHEYDGSGPQNLPGVTSRTAGNARHKIRVPAGSSFADANLTSDVTTQPSPTASTPTGKTMIRPYKTAEPIPPDRKFCVTFVRDYALGIEGFNRRVMFWQAAWADGQFYSNGLYSLTITEVGKVTVEAYGGAFHDEAHWNYKVIHEERVAAGQLSVLRIHISSDAKLVDAETNAYEGTAIYIEIVGSGVQANTSANRDDGARGTTLNGALAVHLPRHIIRIPIPQLSVEGTNPVPTRIEHANDERPAVQVHEAVPVESGYVEDIIDLVTPVPKGGTLYLYWSQLCQHGAAITCQAWNADTGAALTVTGGPTTGETYAGQSYTMPTTGIPPSRIKARFTLHRGAEGSPAKYYQATLKGWSVQIREDMESPDVTPWVINRRGDKYSEGDGRGGYYRGHRSFSFHDGGADASAGAASIEVFDLDGQLQAVRGRGLIACSVWCDYLDPDPTRETYGTTISALLWRGYSLSPHAVRGKRDRNEASSIDPNFHWASLTLVPEAYRLKGSLTNIRQKWFYVGGDEDGKPMRVTERVRRLLAANYGDAHVNIVDLPPRLNVLNGDADVLEPQSTYAEVISSDAREYLSSAVDFDKGTDKWELFQPPVISRPWSSGDTKPLARILTKSRKYGEYITNDDDVRMRVVSGRGGTPARTVEPPEGNAVFVIGGAPRDEASSTGEQSSARLCQRVLRVQVCNHLGLSPTHPHYPRPVQPSDVSVSTSDSTVPKFRTKDYMPFFHPIYIFDPSLGTQDAVDWIARRVYLNACFAREVITVEVPLFFVYDSNRSGQLRERPLRINDVVEYEDHETGEIDRWVVRKLTGMPAFKAHHSYVEAEICRVDWPSGEFGLVDRASDLLAQIAKTAKVALGVSANSSVTSARAKAGQAYSTVYGGMVHVPARDIQVLDPELETFGDLLPPPSWS